MKNRIISVFKDLYRVSNGSKEYNAPITGNMIHKEEFPVVGDYVEVSSEGLSILERQSYQER